MIYSLEPAQYARVQPLVAGLNYHLSIQAVIEGTVAGEVWVDDVTTPQTTYVVTPEGQYLGGSPANAAFNQALTELLLDQPWVSMKYHPDAWEATFPALLAANSPARIRGATTLSSNSAFLTGASGSPPSTSRPAWTRHFWPGRTW